MTLRDTARKNTAVPGSVVAGNVVAGNVVASSVVARGPDAQHEARPILVELETLLDAERAALVRLDRDAIEGYAARKLELDAALQKSVADSPLGDRDLQTLERIRRGALHNQLLLAHARSCVQGMLSLLAPGNAPGYAPLGHAPSSTSAPLPPPIALNLRR